MGLTRNNARTFSVDKWDGYIVERTNLLRFLAEANFRLKFSSPATSFNLVGNLKVDFDDPSSPTCRRRNSDVNLVGKATAGSTPIGLEALSQNPQLKFFNANIGYVRCTMTW